MNGWTASGNRSAEKKTPEKSHIGSMTRFIRPLTVSVVVARLAISRPMPAKARAPTTSTTMTSSEAPPDRHARRPGCRAGAARDRSGIRKVSRAPSRASRKSRRGIGRGDEALEQLGDPEVHQQEADAPEPAPHRVQPDQAGDQEVDVA